VLADVRVLVLDSLLTRTLTLTRTRTLTRTLTLTPTLSQDLYRTTQFTAVLETSIDSAGYGYG
jgi:hypothetical protein